MTDGEREGGRKVNERNKSGNILCLEEIKTQIVERLQTFYVSTSHFHSACGLNSNTFIGRVTFTSTWVKNEHSISKANQALYFRPINLATNHHSFGGSEDESSYPP